MKIFVILYAFFCLFCKNQRDSTTL